jgi:ankyrin repeat protein
VQLTNLVRLFLQFSRVRTVEVNVQDTHGWTALIGATKSGYIDIVDLLLQHADIDINVRDKDGWTALTMAVDGGHAGIVRRLLKHKHINVAASRVREAGFWESVHDSAEGKHTSLPDDLRLQLGLLKMATN